MFGSLRAARRSTAAVAARRARGDSTRDETTHPLLADFVAQLDPINALAERSPGFVWRLKTAEGNSTSIHVFDDERLIVNMSVWESLEALGAYVYGGDHAAVMRQRRTWFERMREIFAALWWVPVGHEPTVAEAEERLRCVRAHGPTPFAFTFRAPFPSPDAQAHAGAAPVDLHCPAR